MKRLHFQYEMQLLFDSMVTDHHFRFHCLPMETESQRVLCVEYGIDPAGTVSERTDGFGNRVCLGEALGPHDHLKVWMRGIVETGCGYELPANEREVPVECLLYTVSTPLTRPGKSLTGFYERCRRGEKSPEGTGSVVPEFLMHELYRNFVYEKGQTQVETGAEEAFLGGKGVCQDYAHILLALCRMAGYPARYVVGLLPGEGATHAWAEVWQDGRWLGLDATHDCRTDERYIKLSQGRDFADCTVDRGCFKGSAAQSQKIYIKVEEENVW